MSQKGALHRTNLIQSSKHILRYRLLYILFLSGILGVTDTSTKHTPLENEHQIQNIAFI